jgi:hypothetical protein
MGQLVRGYFIKFCIKIAFDKKRLQKRSDYENKGEDWEDKKATAHNRIVYASPPCGRLRASLG